MEEIKEDNMTLREILVEQNLQDYMQFLIGHSKNKEVLEKLLDYPIEKIETTGLVPTMVPILIRSAILFGMDLAHEILR